MLQGPSLSRLRIPAEWAAEPSVHARAIERATRARVVSVKLLPQVPALLRRYDASHFGLLAAYTYPHGTLERLEVCNDWHVWLFLFDDEADEQAEVGQRPEYLQEYTQACLAVLRGAAPRAGATPLEHFTFDLRERMRRLASEAWLARFTRDVEDYLHRGTLTAARNWVTGAVPDLETFIEERALDSGMFTAQDLMELTQEGLELPEALFSLPAVQRMRNLCTRVVAQTNDLFSFEKEVLWHGNPNNLVHALRAQRGFGLEEAIESTIDVINADVAAFLACEEQLGESGLLEDPRLRAYVTGMKSWMRGNVSWSLVSGRYCSPTSPFPELRRG